MKKSETADMFDLAEAVRNTLKKDDLRSIMEALAAIEELEQNEPQKQFDIVEMDHTKCQPEMIYMIR